MSRLQSGSGQPSLASCGGWTVPSWLGFTGLVSLLSHDVPGTHAPSIVPSAFTGGRRSSANIYVSAFRLLTSALAAGSAGQKRWVNSGLVTTDHSRFTGVHGREAASALTCKKCVPLEPQESHFNPEDRQLVLTFPRDGEGGEGGGRGRGGETVPQPLSMVCWTRFHFQRKRWDEGASLGGLKDPLVSSRESGPLCPAPLGGFAVSQSPAPSLAFYLLSLPFWISVGREWW